MSTAKRANKSRVFIQDNNVNVNKENNNIPPQTTQSTLVRSKQVATIDWDACNAARMLHKIMDNTEGSREIEIQKNKGKKISTARRVNVEEEKDKDDNDNNDNSYNSYDKDKNNNNETMMKMTEVMIARLRSQEADFQTEVLVIKTFVRNTITK